MQFGYTIIYVPDVSASLTFFQTAFNLPTKFKHPSGTYGELETGSTTLAFASHDLGEMNLPNGYIRAHDSDRPLGMEIALVTEDVEDGHKKAVEAGAREVKAPVTKPWGQVVSYVRCPDGTLVEICSPVK
ncbi:hypothetical protein HDU97_004402 [Phlyctochytrium planicorne]|nr:hypothetical protein HDU97_004402 [Phlyctochytrium planicorne]